jgi:hypothetical protein
MNALDSGAASFEPAAQGAGGVHGGGALLDVTSYGMPGLLGGPQGLGGGSPPAASASAARRRVWTTRFLPERLYEHYAAAAAVTLSALPAAHPRTRELPPVWTTILPLDASAAAWEDRGDGGSGGGVGGVGVGGGGGGGGEGLAGGPARGSSGAASGSRGYVTAL